MTKKTLLILLALLVIFGAVAIIRANKSSGLPYPNASLVAKKQVFSGKELVVVTLHLEKTLISRIIENFTNLRRKTVYAKGSPEDKVLETTGSPFFVDKNKEINVTVKNKKTELNANFPIEILEIDSYTYEITLYPNGSTFKPSEYELEAAIKRNGKVLTLSKNFVWGVLAINTNKSIYDKGEQVYIQMAALTNDGNTKCNANLQLKIIGPDGFEKIFNTSDYTIFSSEECGDNNVTYIPDYYLYFSPEYYGTYTIELTDLETNYKIQSKFTVAIKPPPISVERKSATRINPFKSSYKMEIELVANENFTGTLTDIVPGVFKIEKTNFFDVVVNGNNQEIVWDFNLKKGEKITTHYTYNAPQISPEFFLLGPLSFVDENGNTYVDNNIWQIASDDTENTFRVTAYQLMDDSGGFSGSTYNLTLNNNLEENYFVYVEQAGNAPTSDSNQGPDRAYARVSGDPHSNFSTVTSSNVIQLYRGNSTNNWQGAVNVVECLGDCEQSGFQLVDVVEVTLTGTTTSGSEVTDTNWSDMSQVGLYGGNHGGGASTVESNVAGYQSVWGRIYPSGSNVVNVIRNFTNNGGMGDNGTFTVYAVEWGSEWTIQRVSIYDNSANGGGGIDSTGEYNTGTIASSSRINTFVTAAIAKGDNGLADGADGSVVTLGNGVNQNANETTVAIGTETGGDILDAEVYVHEHPDARVYYYFGEDNSTPGIPTASFTGTHSVNSAITNEIYDNTSTDVRYTEGNRISVLYGSCNGTGNAYPRPQVASRHTANDTTSWFRSRNNQPGAYWLQSVNLENITYETGITISGTAYLDKGLTPLDGSGSSKTISLRVNGSGSYTSEITENDGSWSVSGVDLSTNDIITVYLDNETEKAVTVLVYDGSAELNDVSLYENNLVLRADTGSITNANLATGDDSDSDIFYNVSSGSLTTESGVGIFVWEGDTYDPGGTISTSTSNGDFHVFTGSTIYFDTGTNTVGGDLLIENGSTVDSTSDVILYGSVSAVGNGELTYSSGTPTFSIIRTANLGNGSTSTHKFYNLTLGDSAVGSQTVTLVDSMDIDNTLMLGQGATVTFDINTYDKAITVNTVNITSNGVFQASSNTSYPLTVEKDFTNSGTFTHNNGKVTFSTSETATITGNTTWYDFEVTVPGKTLEFNDGDTQTIQGTLTLTGQEGSNILIRSDNSGVQWVVNMEGDSDVSYITAQDCGCDAESSTINISEGTNMGNNDMCWFFDIIKRIIEFGDGMILEGINVN